MPDAVRRELRWLRAHALISTPLLMVLTLAAFRQEAQQTRFTEIDVERITWWSPAASSAW